jgi:type IV secretory pathway VirB4 component
MSFLDNFKNLIGGKSGEEKTNTLRLVDVIAPSSIQEMQGQLRIEEKFSRSFFVFSYPHYINAGWVSPVINLNVQLDLSFFIHPADSRDVLKKLRKKITEVQAEMIDNEEKGLVRNPVLETAHQDMEELRDRLQTAQEKMFYFGLYITIYGETEKQIEDTESVLRSIFEARVIYIRPALFQQSAGFTSTSPYGMDLLQTHTPMNTEPLSSIFPFISFDLTSSDGILYGINKHNRSLVIFDRFSLENPNAVIFGTSGSGKSYLVKLDVLRSLMVGVEVIIVDPDNEYKTLAESVGGSFFNISLGSSHQINPFDIPIPGEGETTEEVLRTNTINLVGLLRIMLGGLSPEEDALIDQAITETYSARDITVESDPNTWAERVPLLSDLEQVLESMEGTRPLILRLRRFTRGTYSSFFNQHTNISMKNNLTVFGIRDLEDEMRPIAMFIIMRYIWKTVTSSLKKRLFVIDEAWIMMQNEDGASFLFGLVKRARKYWLGVTTITQDVSDFMQSSYGKPIVTNSALKILLKQSSAVIDMIQQTFNLTEEEKFILLEGSVGEGIFFAGQKHVAIKITASYTEDQIITSSPEAIERMKREKARF